MISPGNFVINDPTIPKALTAQQRRRYITGSMKCKTTVHASARKKKISATNTVQKIVVNPR